MSLKLKLVGFFMLLSLLPLAAATYGFHVVLRRSETRRVDVRTAAELRAAVATYRNELDRAARRVKRLSTNRDVQVALQRRRIGVLRAAIAATPNVRIVGRGFAIGARHPNAAQRQALVRSADGRLIGRIIGSVPLSAQIVRELGARSGVQAGDRLVAVRRGHLLRRSDQRLALLPTVPKTVHVLGHAWRALQAGPLAEPKDVSLAILAPQSEIASSAASAERKLELGLLASLLLIGLVAYIIGRSIVRSIARIVQAANDIARGRLGVRVPVRGRDEFALLGRSFNTMAEQLELRLEELKEERNRLQEVTTRFGEALAATHDPDQLRQAVVDTAVEATAAEGGLLVDRHGKRLQAGDPDRGGESIELPLRAGQQSFGTLLLNSTHFTDDQRETAASLVAHAVIALENARLHRIVERQALYDGLTGTANRRHSDAQLEVELQRAHRFGTPLALVLTDLDNFKQINDRWGHPAGDEVLRQFAATLMECVRDIDLVGRWGGEEFVLMLPGTDANGGAQLAERVRVALRGRSILAPDGSTIPLTASFGVAAYPDAVSTDELVAAADGALYGAKRGGKDRVMTASAAAHRQ